MNGYDSAPERPPGTEDGEAKLRVAVWVATALVGVACIGACAAIWLVARAETSTSEALNLAALGFLVAGAAMLWVGYCGAWRWHPPARRRLAVVAFCSLVVLAGAVVAELRRKPAAPSDDRLAEAFYMVQNIRAAQESFRGETGHYLNVSAALAANQTTHHDALYPVGPREPTRELAVTWGEPCSEKACNDDTDWSALPLHVDGPVRFGYSTIAGRAGERPTALVMMDGKAVSWPVPHDDWYIVTAVCDVDGNGVFTTVLASSFTPEIQVDRGSLN